MSQLLTSSKDSEVSVKNDLITLDDQFTQPRIVTATDAEAPMASAEDSLGGSVQSEAECSAGTKSESGIKASIYQELDDAFTTLDQEILETENSEVAEHTLQPSSDGLIYSAPTSIWIETVVSILQGFYECNGGTDKK